VEALWIWFVEAVFFTEIVDSRAEK